MRVIGCTAASLAGFLLKKITFPSNMFIFAQPGPCSVLAAVVSGLSTPRGSVTTKIDII